MARFRSRRSCRVVLSVPIRVFGTDYRGVDFTEDAETVVVNLHGAKIRLTHQLLPDQEIRLFSQATQQDAVFRVVAQAAGSDRSFTYWGVENLDPRLNLWGVQIPALEPDDQLGVRVQLECPHCSAHQTVRLDESLLAALEEEGGVPRECLDCRQSGVWKLLPFNEA